MKSGYYVEWNGDCWQSVFPEFDAHKSQLHTDVDDALFYMVHECKIAPEQIEVLRPMPTPKGGEL